MILSLIVPVYNTAPYLAECLDSMLDQNISGNDYEIVCVNDGSTDGSLEILRDYEARYPNVVVVDKENGGVATARNAGLDAARGEYIWFFDSDDVMHPNVLGQICSMAVQRRADRLTIDVYVFGEQLTQAERTQIAHGTLRAKSHFYDSIVCGSILRRAFLLEHDCRFHYHQITHCEDCIFMYEAGAHDPVCVHLEIPAYLYRTRPGSAQTADSRQAEAKRLKSYVNAALVMQRHWQQGHGSENKTADMLMTMIWRAMHSAAKIGGPEGTAAVAELKRAKLYPFRRPAACTLTRSYQTTRTDAVGKLFDRIYINLHRPWGFAAMKLLQGALWLKYGLRK